MKLSDFYFADRHAEGTKMPILLPSGTDSGEWLRVLGPDCDASIKAGRAYTAAVRAIDEQLRPLEKECEAVQNYARYNDERGYLLEDLNSQLASDIVTGWSFDDEFTKDNLLTLLKQYRGLAQAVAAHHVESRAELSAK